MDRSGRRWMINIYTFIELRGEDQIHTYIIQGQPVASELLDLLGQGL